MSFFLIAGVFAIVIFALAYLTSSARQRSYDKGQAIRTPMGTDPGSDAWMYGNAINAINASSQPESGHHAQAHVDCGSSVHHGGSFDCGGGSGHH